MKRSLCVLSVSLLVGFAAGCADKHEKNQGRLVSLLKELNGVLETISDKASLEAGLPELERVCDRIRVNLRERDEMGDPPKERGSRLAERFGPLLREQSHIMGRHMARIHKIDADDQPLRARRFQAMQDIPPEF